MSKKFDSSRRSFLAASGKAIIAGAVVTVYPGLVSSAAAKKGPVKLAFVPKALNNPVFEVTRAGAEDRVKQLGGKAAFRWVGPTTTDAAAQSQIIDDLVIQGVDGICVSCNDPDALVPAINRAIREGVTVITWDADAPKSKRMTNVSIDQTVAGAEAGKLVAKMASQGKCAVLTGTPGALNLEQRVDGFRSVIDKQPGIEVIATDPCNDDVQRAVEIVEQRINATPDLKSYFFVGMWPFFADLKTMPQLKKFVANGGVCVSLDSLEGALNAVDQGYCNALVGYSWYGFGVTSVDVLMAKITEKKDSPEMLYTDLFIVDKDNIASYMQKHKETGGRF